MLLDVCIRLSDYQIISVINGCSVAVHTTRQSWGSTEQRKETLNKKSFIRIEILLMTSLSDVQRTIKH